MADRECAVNAREYSTPGGVLIIESAAGNEKKSDVISEMLAYMACSAPREA